MKIAESEFVMNSDGTVFHLHLHPWELADNVILVGDPGRVDLIAEFFDTIEFRRQAREFVTVTGQYKGKRVTALSTGIGTDNIDIVMNELDALANIDFETREVRPEHKALNIIRIGTSGSVQKDIPLGSFVFANISAGFDGLLYWYAGIDKINDRELWEAFKAQMDWNEYLPIPYFVHAHPEMVAKFADCTVPGMTISASGFYGPQGRVLRLPLAMPSMVEKIENFSCRGLRLTNFEMESSAIAGLSAHLGHKAGTVCCIIANRYLKTTNTDYKPKIRELIQLVLEKI